MGIFLREFIDFSVTARRHVADSRPDEEKN